MKYIKLDTKIGSGGHGVAKDLKERGCLLRMYIQVQNQVLSEYQYETHPSLTILTNQCVHYQAALGLQQ